MVSSGNAEQQSGQSYSFFFPLATPSGFKKFVLLGHWLVIKRKLTCDHSKLLEIMGSDHRQTKQSKPTKKSLDSNGFFINMVMNLQTLVS